MNAPKRCWKTRISATPDREARLDKIVIKMPDSTTSFSTE
jgi:hypothetical protein